MGLVLRVGVSANLVGDPQELLVLVQLHPQVDRVLEHVLGRRAELRACRLELGEHLEPQLLLLLERALLRLVRLRVRVRVSARARVRVRVRGTGRVEVRVRARVRVKVGVKGLGLGCGCGCG